MTIKFFDFLCANGHRFEGSFPSLEEMNRQLQARLVRCPVCGEADVRRLPSASHLATKSGEKAQARRGEERMREKVEAIMSAVREAANRAQDVGEDFARESRRMKNGLAPRRLIKGQCSVKEAEKLIEEGISVLPVPESSGKTLN